MTPQVRVVRGAPDELELAALVAGIVAGRANGAADAGGDAGARQSRRARADRRRWVDGARRLHGPLAHGGDAWRWSGRA